MHPCVQCAGLGPTCCQRSEVLVTRGDIGRVAEHTWSANFWERRPVCDASVLDQPDDPNFVRWAFNEQGARRILKRRPDGACVFLSTRGCSLPTVVRPLVCRLYPRSYNESGLVAIDSNCPTELVPPGKTILQVLNIDDREAERWRRTLYEELRQEWEEHAHRDDL